MAIWNLLMTYGDILSSLSCRQRPKTLVGYRSLRIRRPAVRSRSLPLVPLPGSTLRFPWILDEWTWCTNDRHLHSNYTRLKRIWGRHARRTPARNATTWYALFEVACVHVSSWECCLASPPSLVFTTTIFTDDLNHLPAVQMASNIPVRAPSCPIASKPY